MMIENPMNPPRPCASGRVDPSRLKPNLLKPLTYPKGKALAPPLPLPQALARPAVGGPESLVPLWRASKTS